MAEQRPRQLRAERTRLKIIETAALAFAEHGFNGVSLNDLVKGSGVSKGAFYFHFRSKDDLALAAFRSKQEELVARLLDDPGPGMAASERIAVLLRRRAQLLSEDASLRCVTRLGAELNARSGPGSEYASFQDLALGLIADVVSEGQRNAEFRADVQPQAAARAIFSWIVGLDTMSLLSSGGEDLEERSEEVLALLLPALQAPVGITD